MNIVILILAVYFATVGLTWVLGASRGPWR